VKLKGELFEILKTLKPGAMKFFVNEGCRTPLVGQPHQPLIPIDASGAYIANSTIESTPSYMVSTNRIVSKGALDHIVNPIYCGSTIEWFASNLCWY
jgi:hypothetical protein